ncbi:hypothetical protein XFF6992_650019 [Xanthomonas citri pv. fuscans]|nr:hypothetical protein XFF6992_650019 [Xanthomonas citri pv. fuscans]SOO35697.1 hypothetical protein XFF6994_5630018 [Xanthomonas citri pv. fuscans]
MWAFATDGRDGKGATNPVRDVGGRLQRSAVCSEWGIGSALRLIALRVACRTACGSGEMSDAGGRPLIRPFGAPSPGGRREWRVADAVLFRGLRPRGCALDAQASATADVGRCAVTCIVSLHCSQAARRAIATGCPSARKR